MALERMRIWERIHDKASPPKNSRMDPVPENHPRLFFYALQNSALNNSLIYVKHAGAAVLVSENEREQFASRSRVLHEHSL